MKSEKIISWVSANGANIDVKITATKDILVDKNDWGMEYSRETFEGLEIGFYANDKCVESSRCEPMVTTAPQLLKMGSYGQIGRVGISKENYERIMKAVTEVQKECIYTEYAELKAIEDEKASKAKARAIENEAKYQKELKNGLCPRCGSYCYGDCTAH